MKSLDARRWKRAIISVLDKFWGQLYDNSIRFCWVFRIISKSWILKNVILHKPLYVAAVDKKPTYDSD